MKGFFLYFYAGKLEMISLTLDPKHFADVVGALTKRYGTGSLETETLQNVTGGTFENNLLMARTKHGTLEAPPTAGREIETSSGLSHPTFSGGFSRGGAARSGEPLAQAHTSTR